MLTALNFIEEIGSLRKYAKAPSFCEKCEKYFRRQLGNLQIYVSACKKYKRDLIDLSDEELDCNPNIKSTKYLRDDLFDDEELI